VFYRLSLRTLWTKVVCRISGTHSVGSLTSWIYVVTPCSPLKVNRYFGETCRFNLQGQGISQTTNQHEVVASRACFTIIYCLAYLFTLKIEAACSSETSVDFQRTISEDRTLQMNTGHSFPPHLSHKMLRHMKLQYMFVVSWNSSIETILQYLPL
jgi:hypothetical protein